MSESGSAAVLDEDIFVAEVEVLVQETEAEGRLETMLEEHRLEDDFENHRTVGASEGGVGVVEMGDGVERFGCEWRWHCKSLAVLSN